MADPGAVLGGVAAGLGVLIAICAFAPARPDLRAALTQLNQPPGPATAWTTTGAAGTGGGWEYTVGRWLAHRLARTGRRLRVPATDLDILDRSVEVFLAQKLAMALLGLALPAGTATVLAIVGIRLPIALPVALGLGLAVVLSFAPDLVARSAGAEARDDFRHAVAAYLTLVALERAADGGPADSLERAATVGHGWVFTRITAALGHARIAGITPWQALAELATQVGVTELGDLADIVSLAGGEGAAVYDTLLGKATSMRRASSAAAEAHANSRSEQMTLPTVLLFCGFLILLIYPALARAFTAT